METMKKQLVLIIPILSAMIGMSAIIDNNLVSGIIVI